MSGAISVESRYPIGPNLKTATTLVESHTIALTQDITPTEILTGSETFEQVDPSSVIRMNLNTGETRVGEEVVVPAYANGYRNSAALCVIDDGIDGACLANGYCGEHVKVKPSDVIESGRQTFSRMHSIVHSSQKPEFDPRNVLCSVEPSPLSDDFAREGLHTIEAYFQHMFDGAQNTYETTGPYVPEIKQFKAQYGDKSGIGTHIAFFDYRTKSTGFMSMFPIGRDNADGETIFFKQAGAENPFCYELRYTNDEGIEFVFLFYAAKNILPQQLGFAFTPQKDINGPLDTQHSRSMGFEVQYDDSKKEGRILIRTAFPGESAPPKGAFDLFIPWIQQFWPFGASAFIDPGEMIEYASTFADKLRLTDEQRKEFYDQTTKYIIDHNTDVTSQIVKL